MTKDIVGRLRPEQLAAILRDDERARVRATLPMGIDEAEVDRIAAMSVTWEAANLLDSLSPPDGVGLTRYRWSQAGHSACPEGPWVRYEDAAAALALLIRARS